MKKAEIATLAISLGAFAVSAVSLYFSALHQRDAAHVFISSDGLEGLSSPVDGTQDYSALKLRLVFRNPGTRDVFVARLDGRISDSPALDSGEDVLELASPFLLEQGKMAVKFVVVPLRPQIGMGENGLFAGMFATVLDLDGTLHEAKIPLLHCRVNGFDLGTCAIEEGSFPLVANGNIPLAGQGFPALPHRMINDSE